MLLTSKINILLIFNKLIVHLYIIKLQYNATRNSKVFQ